MNITSRLIPTAAFALLLTTNTLAADGQLDPGFGGGSGVAYADFSYLSANILSQRMTAVKTDASGQIVGVGYFLRNASGNDYDCSIVRRNSAGTGYDATFLAPNGYGPLAIDLGGDLADSCFSLEILANGKIAIAGESNSGANSKTGTLVLLNADGSRVSSFFSNGLFRANVDLALLAQQSISSSAILALTKDQQGRLLALGTFDVSATIIRSFVVRFTAAGALDPSFGIDGLVIVPDVGADFSGASDIALQGDKILLAKSRNTNGGALSAELVKLLDNGALDSSFGAGSGRVTIGNCRYFTAMALAPQDQIVLGCVPTSGRYGIVRLNSGGDLDLGFASGGFAELRAPTALQEIVSIDDVVVQADGKIIAVGDLRNLVTFSQSLNGEEDIVIGRFTSAGNRDLTFGYVSGQSDFRFGNPQGTMTEAVNESVSSLVLDPQDRVLIAGRRSLPGVSGGFGNQQLIARLQGPLPDNVFQNGFE
jgi:uncharacterized delta-60 repeat protein